MSAVARSIESKMLMVNAINSATKPPKRAEMVKTQMKMALAIQQAKNRSSQPQLTFKPKTWS